jgi:hypothetical protein
MRTNNFLSAVLSGALVAATASGALAQSGYDTGAGKASETTTNSGAARPDETENGAMAPVEKRSGKAQPATSGTGAKGERGQRPDAHPTSAPAGNKANAKPKRASQTQTDD